MMLLERKLVAKLENYNILYGNRIELIDFLAHVSNPIWPRWNYFFSRAKFAKKIVHVFQDCIGEGYIESGNEKIAVTSKGRNFISWSGFCEEYRKRRKRFTDLLLSLLLSSAATGVVIHFWPKISVIL